MAYKHTPVMLKEVIQHLNPRPGQKLIDCTLGGGGYSQAIRERIGSSGQLLAIDLDKLAIDNFKIKILNLKLTNISLVQDNFKNLREIVKRHVGDYLFDGIVFDLGLSSAQLEDQGRGFSFNLTGSPLGMNFAETAGPRAEEIINEWSMEDLTKIFKDYGEEKFARKIALAIVRERRINRIAASDQLAKVITGAMPKKFQTAKTHPATRIFQALRIAVNQELDNLRQALPQAVSLLKPGGKLVIISYHSLEDRIVKQYFKQESRDCLCPPNLPICQCGHQAQIKMLARRVRRPSPEEIRDNPRARSAKLRAAEKI